MNMFTWQMCIKHVLSNQHIVYLCFNNTSVIFVNIACYCERVCNIMLYQLLFLHLMTWCAYIFLQQTLGKFTRSGKAHLVLIFICLSICWLLWGLAGRLTNQDVLHSQPKINHANHNLLLHFCFVWGYGITLLGHLYLIMVAIIFAEEDVQIGLCYIISV